MFQGTIRTVRHTDGKSHQIDTCLFYNAEPRAYISSTKTDMVGTSRNVKDAGQYHQRCQQHIHTHTHTAKPNFSDASLLICPQQTINILAALHDFDVDRRHFALGAISRHEELLHLIADLLDVTGVMN